MLLGPLAAVASLCISSDSAAWLDKLTTFYADSEEVELSGETW